MIQDFDFVKKLNSYKIVLGSGSPRRQFLLKDLGLQFSVVTSDFDEVFPEQLVREEIPVFLCTKKAEAINIQYEDNTLVITADTIVWVDNKVLNKPGSEAEAVQMLELLSGKMHEVITAVCLKTKDKEHAFYTVTKVFFKTLTKEEIRFYVTNYKPFDKAGAYGAQEWIGYVGVERIEGSYFNVMGLPMKELYEEMLRL